MANPSNHLELQCEYVSTHGLAFLCDQTIVPYSRNNFMYTWNTKVTRHGTTVYTNCNEMDMLMQTVDNYEAPIIIMVNGDDHLAPYGYSKFVQNKVETSPNVLAVLAQNCCVTDKTSKWKHLPIGLDYHTLLWSSEEGNCHEWGASATALDQEALLKSIRMNMRPIYDAPYSTVITNFHLAMDAPKRRAKLRQPIYHACKNTPWITWLPQQTREEFWRSCNDCAFVLCPPGNGYDTHRAWEALCLGRIPIIQDLPINEVYRDLPVWIVSDWNHFAQLTVDDLKRVWSDMVSKWKEYKWQKLRLQYWKNYIQHIQNEVVQEAYAKAN